MQPTPSLQSTGVPATQSLTALQTSTPLQYVPSSQLALFGVLSQLSVASLQLSTVQLTPSLQSTGVPAWQSLTASQVSAPLQYAPSSQFALFGVLSQLSVPSLQLSTVQPTPSSQTTGVPAWQSSVASQVSAPLQNAPSSHSVLFGVLTQLSVDSLQVSSVQLTPSLQSTGVPATQSLTALQTSSPLQYAPSSHSALFGALSQLSVPSLQLSTVQSTPSAQLTGDAATHCPATHCSAPLQ